MTIRKFLKIVTNVTQNWNNLGWQIFKIGAISIKRAFGNLLEATSRRFRDTFLAQISILAKYSGRMMH